ncbi:MAG: hypothetical protein JWN48_1419 [Myxococcaceae bacterium]|nr:hypothetical protein [Myxococcaceae bacterium]
MMGRRSVARARRTLAHNVGFAGCLSIFLGCAGAIEDFAGPNGSSQTKATGSVGAGDAPASTGAQGLNADPTGVAGMSAGQQGVVGGADEAIVSTSPDLRLVSSCTADTLRGAAREGVRRLSKREFTAALEIAVGYGYYEVKSMVDALPEAYEAQPGESFQPLHSLAEVESFIELMTAAADSMIKFNRHKEFADNYCMNDAKPSDACVRNVLAGLGQTIFRRPLAATELDDYLAMQRDALAAGTMEQAMHRVMLRMLLSPDFLFHLEVGGSKVDGRVRLTPSEIASRISFSTVGGPPDQALRDAAAQGGLDTLEAVQAQVRRLLDTDAAKAQIDAFIYEYLNLRKVTDPSRMMAEIGGFQYSNPMGMTKDLQQEVYDFVRYIIWNKKGTFKDLMTAPIAVPTEDRVALVYGAGKTVADKPVSTPGHPGLVTRAALLVSAVETTSPILRGVSVLRRVLCNPLPSPDFSVVAERLTDLGAYDHMKMANHEIVSDTTAPPTCNACHQLINPIGFVLESFDSLGRTQSVENVWGINPDDSFKPESLLTHPLPPPQDVTIEPGLPTRYAGPQDLVDGLAASNNARACFTERLFRFTQRRPEHANDACALHDTSQQLQGDTPILEALVRSVANEDIFWRAAP